jgi:hypothetical protein
MNRETYIEILAKEKQEDIAAWNEKLAKLQEESASKPKGSYDKYDVDYIIDSNLKDHSKETYIHILRMLLLEYDLEKALRGEGIKILYIEEEDIEYYKKNSANTARYRNNFTKNASHIEDWK